MQQFRQFFKKPNESFFPFFFLSLLLLAAKSEHSIDINLKINRLRGGEQEQEEGEVNMTWKTRLIILRDKQQLFFFKYYILINNKYIQQQKEEEN